MGLRPYLPLFVPPVHGSPEPRLQLQAVVCYFKRLCGVVLPVSIVATVYPVNAATVLAFGFRIRIQGPLQWHGRDLTVDLPRINNRPNRSLVVANAPSHPHGLPVDRFPVQEVPATDDPMPLSLRRRPSDYPPCGWELVSLQLVDVSREFNLLETDIVLQGFTSTSKHVDRVARRKAGLDTAVDGKSFETIMHYLTGELVEGRVVDAPSQCLLERS